MRGLALLGMAIAIEGCYAPPSASVACGAKCTDSCPDDLVCQNSVCVKYDGSSCPVPALDYAAIVVGARHSCALTTAGDVYCWGDNSKGQIAAGSEVAATAIPTAVAPQDGAWTAVSAGAQHTCGVHAGMAMCWGSNKNGESVAGRGGVIATPMAVMFALGATPPAFTAIAAGGAHSCAVGSGQLWCWGLDDEVGTGMPTTLATQITTPDSSDSWAEVAAGYDHSCGITVAGVVACWGANDVGQCGQPGGLTVATPTAVSVPGTPIAIYAGNSISCAITAADASATSGALYCWGGNQGGYANRIDRSGVDYTTATAVGAATDWTSVAGISYQVMCGTRSDGNLYCWGTDNSASGAQAAGLWSSGDVDPMTPNLVGTGDAVVGSSVIFQDGMPDERFGAFGCARTGTTAACWGDNSAGELGNGLPSESSVAVEVMAPHGTWQHVSAGDEHVCATLDDDSLWCWGADGEGQVSAGVARGDDQPCVAGQPCDYARPTAAPAPVTQVDELVSGVDYTCVLTGGHVLCWGDGAYTALPDQADAPQVSMLTGTWRRISGGKYATCAFPDATSAPSCWGNPFNNDETRQPIMFDDPNGAMTSLGSISFGQAFACAYRTSDNERVCWGNDASNQLGSVPVMTDIADPTEQADGPYSAVTAGYAYGCAIDSTQQVVCWGRDDNEEAGQDLGGKDVTSPTPVAQLPGGCTSLSLGSSNSCAVCGGAVWCWGANYASELGAGPTIPDVSLAVPVVVPSGITFDEVSTADFGACAIGGGRLFCWGDGQHGTLGNGAKSRNIPTPIGTTD